MSWWYILIKWVYFKERFLFFIWLLVALIISVTLVHLFAHEIISTQLSFMTQLNKHYDDELKISVIGSPINTDKTQFDSKDKLLFKKINNFFGDAYKYHQVYMSSSMMLVEKPNDSFNQMISKGKPITRGYFAYISNVDWHQTFAGNQENAAAIVDYKKNPEVIDAMIGSEVAEWYGVKQGDYLRVVRGIDQSYEWTNIRIFGIIDKNMANNSVAENFHFFINPQGATTISAPPPIGVNVDTNDPLFAFFVDKDSFYGVSTKTDTNILFPIWNIALSRDLIKNIHPKDMRTDLIAFRESITREMPGSNISYQTLDGVVDVVLERRRITAFVDRIFYILIVIVSVITLFVVSIQIANKRWFTMCILCLRGAQFKDLTQQYFVESIVIFFVTVIGSLLISLGILQYSYLQLGILQDPINTLSNIILSTQYVIFISMFIGLASAFLYMSIGWISASLVFYRKYQISSLVQKQLFKMPIYFVDIFVVIIGIFFYWQIHNKSLVLLTIDDISFLSGLISSAIFVFIILAATTFSIWVFTQIVSYCSKKMEFISSDFYVFSIFLSRSSGDHKWISLSLSIVGVVMVFATTLWITMEKQRSDSIQYRRGVDLRVTNIGTFGTGSFDNVLEKVNMNLNIDNFSIGWRSSFNIEGDVGQVLAINPNEILDQSWFHRDDFSNTNITELMKSIMSDQYTRKIILPERSTEIGLWAKSLDIFSELSVLPERSTEIGLWTKSLDTFSELSVWVVLIDANQQVEAVSLGKVKGIEWDLLKATIPINLVDPIYITGVQFFQPGTSGILQIGDVLLDDVHVVSNSGERRELNLFTDEYEWELIPLPFSLDKDFVYKHKDIIRGEVLKVSLPEFSINNIRAIYIPTNIEYIPAIVSKSFGNQFLEINNRKVLIKIDEVFLPIEIKETTEYFSTLDLDSGHFIIVDIRALSDYFSFIKGKNLISPNELFVQFNDQSTISRGVISARSFGSDNFDSIEESTVSETIDSFNLRVSKTNLVLLCFFMSILLAGILYLVFIIRLKRRIGKAYWVLWNLGMSQKSLICLAIVEFFVIGIVSLLIGTLIGSYFVNVLNDLITMEPSLVRHLIPHTFVLNTDILIIFSIVLIGMWIIYSLYISRFFSNMTKDIGFLSK